MCSTLVLLLLIPCYYPLYRTFNFLKEILDLCRMSKCHYWAKDICGYVFMTNLCHVLCKSATIVKQMLCVLTVVISSVFSRPCLCLGYRYVLRNIVWELSWKYFTVFVFWPDIEHVFPSCEAFAFLIHNYCIFSAFIFGM
jgi:hypothetical protein